MNCNCGCNCNTICKCSKDNKCCDCSVINVEKVNKVKENIIDNNLNIKLSNIFKIFSDQTRLRILTALEIEELCVYDIANVLNMTKSTVSHQLKILRENNLVKFNKVGKTSYYSLADEHVKLIIDIALEHVNEI